MKESNFYIFFLFFIVVVIGFLLKWSLGLILALAFIIWCLRNFIKPVYDLNRHFKNFSGNSSQDLVSGFRTILNEIEKSEQKANRAEQRFKVLLELFANAIAILDEDGRLKFYNENFKLFSRAETGEGSFYWECIRDFDLIQLVKQLVETYSKNLKVSKEIEIEEKNYLVSAFKTQGEIFLVINDITFQKELAEIKRELVENISHELKTPLSNIKGYIETVEEELRNLSRKTKAIQEIINYLEPVKRNMDRLIRIINDLLILSEVEAGITFVEEKIDFEAIINGILKMDERSIKDKRLYCKVSISKELPEFWGDPYRIEQMLSNLIDNAIKYTDKGGIKIKIEPAFEFSKEKPDRIKIIVEDTGIGIAKEHLPRIFERFYVVDKSRSRQSGGTGLGLSIVKHIVLLYNGSINVESKIGFGSKFEILLPIRKKANPSEESS